MSDNSVILNELNKLKEEFNKIGIIVEVESGDKIISKYSSKLEQLIYNCNLSDDRKKDFIDMFSESIILASNKESIEDIYKMQDKLKQAIDLLIKELELKNKLNDFKEEKEDIFYSLNKKELKILNYFKNGDKTKLDYMNSTNQEFDKLLFDLLFRKKYLSFRDVNLKYSELETGEKYSFGSGINDNKVIMTTADGDKYLESEIKKQTLDIVGGMPSFRAINDLMKPYKDISNMFKAFNISNEVLNNIAGISNISKNVSVFSNVFKPIQENLELFKPVYPKIEFDKFKDIISVPTTTYNLEQKIDQVKDVHLRNSVFLLNITSYGMLCEIESDFRDQIYMRYGLNEKDDFKKYEVLREKLSKDESNSYHLDKIKKRFDTEKNNSLPKYGHNYKLIEYFDFENLKSCIGDKDIYKEYQNKSRDKLVELIEDVSNIRKKIAHSRVISQLESLKIKQLYDSIVKKEAKENDKSN